MKKIFFLFILFASCKNQSIKNIAGTYGGKYFCADCSGIDVQLQINADSSFWLNEKYYFGKYFLRFIDSGKWVRKNNDRLILSGTTELPHQYKIISDSILQMLDSDGKEIQSTNSNQIKLIDATSISTKVPIGDTLIGMYSYNDNQVWFTDCGTQNKIKVAKNSINTQIEKEYNRIQRKPNDLIFVKLIGYYSLQHLIKGAGVERVVVPNVFIEMDASSACR